MLQLLCLLLIVLLVSYILFLALMRIYHPFWSIQPVYHFYDLKYLWNTGVIQKAIPEKNRYINFNNIEIKNIKDITAFELKKSVYFIQDNYLNTDDIIYKPSIEHISSYFQNHNQNCYFSFYKKENNLVNVKNNTIISSSDIIGMVTSRPIYLHFYSKNTNKSLNVYYIDYLCVDLNHRKKNIVPELLQTHEYKQRRLNKKVNVCLFKREGHIMFILPIVLYYAYCYDINYIPTTPLKPCYKCELIHKKNSNLLLNLLNKTKNKFSLFGITDLSNILTLIENKVYHIYILLKYNNPIAVYFYKNPMLTYNNNTAIELFASICHCNYTLFYLGFMESYKNVSKDLNQKYIILEEISHNFYLNNILKNKYPILFNTPYSYYLYNYSHKLLKKEDVFFLI
jgi:hypothetical protein